MKKQWWKEAVAYQIYPEALWIAMGMVLVILQGIISKLDYLKGFRNRCHLDLSIL